MWPLCVLIVASASLNGVAGISTTVCPTRSLQFLSANSSLVPPENVEASSETIDNPAASFVAPDTVPWCTEPITLENGTLPADYHINVTFTEPLVLTLLMSGGFINGFVNNFTIAYSASVDDDNLTVYGVTEDVTNFIVDNILGHDVFFTLERPIVAQKLVFSINSGRLTPVIPQLCWEIVLFGCTQTEAAIIEPEMCTETLLNNTPTTTTTTTMTVNPEPTSCTSVLSTSCTPVVPGPGIETSTPVPPCPPGMANSTQENTCTTENVLAIVLSVALVTVLVVAGIVAAGVIVCTKYQNKTGKGSKESGYETVTVKVLDNSHLYNTASEASVMRSNTLPSGVSAVYDVPRPISYDVPRSRIGSPSSTTTRSRTSTNASLKEIMLEKKRSSAEEQQREAVMSDATYEIVPDGLTSIESRLYDVPAPDSKDLSFHIYAIPTQRGSDSTSKCSTPVCGTSEPVPKHEKTQNGVQQS